MMDLHSPTPSDLPLLGILVVAGACASGVNAFAGGGSLISFPTLVVMGVPPQVANATNSVALFPGSLASAFGFRDHLEKTKSRILLLLGPTIVGSAIGSLLLVNTPQKLFQFAVPILIFIATMLLILQPWIKSIVRKDSTPSKPAFACVAQFFISVYGGYFGAGMGIMMLAAYGVLLEGTIHDMNAIKNWLAVAINVMASAMFVCFGLIWIWPAAALMVGAIVGGYAIARLSLKLDPEWLRRGVIVLGIVLTAWFTARAFGVTS